MRFVPLIEKTVRKRKKFTGNSWRMDETYIKLNGKWIYLYRAVDSMGNTIDFLLRAHRHKPAAKAFFKKAIKHNGHPEKTAIDKSGSNIASLKDLNEGVPKEQKIELRQNKYKYLNNLVEQDQRFIKKRVKPMLGVKNFYSAKTTIAGIEMVHMIKKGQTHGFDAEINLSKLCDHDGVVRLKFRKKKPVNLDAEQFSIDATEPKIPLSSHEKTKQKKLFVQIC